jgi:CRP-like cAMP-binding protein
MGRSILEVLQGLPFVEDMEPSHVDRLATMVKEAGFVNDQIIFREGDLHAQFYIVISGKVALESTTDRGILRVQTVEEGHELGWSFMLAETGRHFRARALGPARVLVFDGAKLRHACEQDPEFGYRVMKRVLRVVSDRLVATRQRLLDVHGS